MASYGRWRCMESWLYAGHLFFFGGGGMEVVVVVVRSLSVIWILQPKFLICVRSCEDLESLRSFRMSTRPDR